MRIGLLVLAMGAGTLLSGCALAVGAAAAVVIDEIAEENGRDLF